VVGDSHTSDLCSFPQKLGDNDDEKHHHQNTDKPADPHHSGHHFSHIVPPFIFTQLIDHTQRSFLAQAKRQNPEQ